MTEAVARRADHFRTIGRDTPDEAARRTFDDGIDVLIGLAWHSAGNGLPLFARKPAPMQVTWLGYPCTTGLTRMDYRLGLGAPPPGLPDPNGTERLVGLSPYPLFSPSPMRRQWYGRPVPAIRYPSGGGAQRLPDHDV